MQHNPSNPLADNVAARAKAIHDRLAKLLGA